MTCTHVLQALKIIIKLQPDYNQKIQHLLKRCDIYHLPSSSIYKKRRFGAAFRNQLLKPLGHFSNYYLLQKERPIIEIEVCHTATFGFWRTLHRTTQHRKKIRAGGFAVIIANSINLLFYAAIQLKNRLHS